MILPSDILPFFQKAGWSADRQIILAPWVRSVIPHGHPAGPLLSTFTGLTVGECGAGEQCATSDIVFGFIEPEEDIKTWSELLDTALIGLASVCHHHGQLFMDSSGRVFCLSGIHDAFWFEGETFLDAIRALLFGRRTSRPMLRPDQESVDLGGDTFTRESPELFLY